MTPFPLHNGGASGMKSRMRFQLVDKVERIEPGKRIVTVKALSLAEEYLADHFPAFPVLPGVLMLEAMVESAAWLVRVAQDFSKSIVELCSVRNVKYANFVAPGNIMRCEVEVIELGPEVSKFKGAANVDGRTTVSGRFDLKSFNLVDRAAFLADADQQIIEQLRRQWKLVHGPEAMSS